MRTLSLTILVVIFTAAVPLTALAQDPDPIYQADGVTFLTFSALSNKQQQDVEPITFDSEQCVGVIGKEMLLVNGYEGHICTSGAFEMPNEGNSTPLYRIFLQDQIDRRTHDSAFRLIKADDGRTPGWLILLDGECIFDNEPSVAFETDYLITLTAASNGFVTCHLQVGIDPDALLWEELRYYGGNPYDRAMMDPDGTVMGDTVGIFALSDGGVLQINDQPNFALDVDACTTCYFSPTQVSGDGPVHETDDWQGLGNEPSPHDINVVMLLDRATAATDPSVFPGGFDISFSLVNGQSLTLWTGAVVTTSAGQ